jgi:hypothetical protein
MADVQSTSAARGRHGLETTSPHCLATRFLQIRYCNVSSVFTVQEMFNFIIWLEFPCWGELVDL